MRKGMISLAACAAALAVLLAGCAQPSDDVRSARWENQAVALNNPAANN